MMDTVILKDPPEDEEEFDICTICDPDMPMCDKCVGS